MNDSGPRQQCSRHDQRTLGSARGLQRKGDTQRCEGQYGNQEAGTQVLRIGQQDKETGEKNPATLRLAKTQQSQRCQQESGPDLTAQLAFDCDHPE